MSLRIRFRFDGRCSIHPRYNPEKDAGPQDKNCPGCESLHVIHLYTKIARRKAEAADGLIVSRPQQRTETGEQADVEGAIPSSDTAAPKAS
jgi:hypothetical protein